MDDKTQSVLEHVEASTDQIMAAIRTGDLNSVKAVLVYWFSVMYEEGRHAAQRAAPVGLKDTVAKLKEMNRRLSETQLPVAPEDPEDPT